MTDRRDDPDGSGSDWGMEHLIARGWTLPIVHAAEPRWSARAFGLGMVAGVLAGLLLPFIVIWLLGLLAGTDVMRCDAPKPQGHARPMFVLAE